MSLIRPDFTRSAIFSASRALFTWYGSSLITIREPGRTPDGLWLVPVVVRNEVDRLRVDVAKELERDRREPSLGVSHGGRWVAVDGAEVAVRVDQRMAQRPILRQPHEGVVHGFECMRVVLLHDLPDRPRGLPVRPIRPEAPLEHRPEHPAVHGLQTVTHLGERSADDDRHRVVEVGALDLLLELDRFDVPCEQAFLGHGRSSVASQTSRFWTYRALDSMNSLRGGTSSPISTVNR